MDQFRHVGEVLGSLKALMVMKQQIPINQKQCTLLLDIFSQAFTIISDLIKTNLKLEERNIKWKALDPPLKELHTVFKEGEAYVKHCMDHTKNWWCKALTLLENKDCVEFHIYNLLSLFPAVVEAIETSGEFSGLDEAEMERKRLLLKKKYDDKDWNDPDLFALRFGRDYLVSPDTCHDMDRAWREDQHYILDMLREYKSSDISKNELRLTDLLIRKINGSDGNLSPSSVLSGLGDFVVKKRLSGSSQLKEIQWLGEQFVMRQFHSEVEIEPLIYDEINGLLSLSHPNVLQYLCGFYDEEKREVSLVMEFMHRDVHSYMKENCGARRQLLFSIPVVVDILLQIARGMEYLHARGVFHGDLNPGAVLLKPRYLTEGYFHVKVACFGSRKIDGGGGEDNNVWLAPEVLSEQEENKSTNSTNNNLKYSEKADVYSFGMLAFDLLTGKVPFEAGYVPGDKSNNNIMAGGRPLFPFTTPKYLASLTKRCWHADPTQRPSFGSVCRVLRYVKRFLIMNCGSDDGQPQLQVPPVEYLEIESGFLKRIGREKGIGSGSVTRVPFEIFSYRVLERTRIGGLVGPEGDEVLDGNEDPNVRESDLRSVCSEVADRRAFAAVDTRSFCSEAPDDRAFSLIKPDTSDNKKSHVASVLPEIPERKSSSPGRDSKSSGSSRKKSLQSKDTSSMSSGSPRKKNLIDTLTRSSSDTNPRLALSEPPRKRGVKMSVSSDALDRNAMTSERRARPEGAMMNKRMLSLKMTKNKLDSSKSSTWNPCGRSVKIGKDTKPISVASPRVASPKRRPMSGSGSTDIPET